MTNNFYLKSITIKSFRGLSNINIDKLNDVNLILGDNNSGKTSFLESVYLLKSNDIFNFCNVASCRQENQTLNISSVKFLYPMSTKTIEINAKANIDINFYSSYSISQVSFSQDVYFDEEQSPEKNTINTILKKLIDSTKYEGRNINQINGEIRYNNDVSHYSLIDLDFYGKLLRGNKNDNKIVYVSPSNHYNLNAINISSIIKNKNYHNILVELLRLFDPSIEDILLASSDGVFALPEINIRRKGNNEAEPISLFGDGMKKAIALATYVVNASGGILLIDEIETSLHYSLFKDIFTFLLLAAKQFNVQLFIATHNIEVIDAILNVNEDRLANTCLITLQTGEKGISYRYLAGNEAKQNRKHISMEVR